MSLSSYQQFWNDFNVQLHDTASFESNNSEDETLQVIKQAISKTNLESILNKFDEMRKNELREADLVAGGAVTAAVSAPTTKSKKTTAVAPATAAVTEAHPDENQPKKKGKATRGKTGYNVFIAEQLADKKMQMPEAAALWKTLSDDEKKVWNTRAAEAKEASD